MSFPMGLAIKNDPESKKERRQNKRGYIDDDIPLLESFGLIKNGKEDYKLSPEHYVVFIDWLADGPVYPVPQVVLKILCHYRKKIQETIDNFSTTDGQRIQSKNIMTTIDEMIKAGDDSIEPGAMCASGGDDGMQDSNNNQSNISECCDELKSEIENLKIQGSALKEQIEQAKNEILEKIGTIPIDAESNNAESNNAESNNSKSNKSVSNKSESNNSELIKQKLNEAISEAEKASDALQSVLEKQEVTIEELQTGIKNAEASALNIALLIREAEILFGLTSSRITMDANQAVASNGDNKNDKDDDNSNGNNHSGKDENDKDDDNSNGDNDKGKDENDKDDDNSNGTNSNIHTGPTGTNSHTGPTGTNVILANNNHTGPTGTNAILVNNNHTDLMRANNILRNEVSTTHQNSTQGNTGVQLGETNTLVGDPEHVSNGTNVNRGPTGAIYINNLAKGPHKKVINNDPQPHQGGFLNQTNNNTGTDSNTGTDGNTGANSNNDDNSNKGPNDTLEINALFEKAYGSLSSLRGLIEEANVRLDKLKCDDMVAHLEAKIKIMEEQLKQTDSSEDTKHIELEKELNEVKNALINLTSSGKEVIPKIKNYYNASQAKIEHISKEITKLAESLTIVLTHVNIPKLELENIINSVKSSIDALKDAKKNNDTTKGTHAKLNDMYKKLSDKSVELSKILDTQKAIFYRLTNTQNIRSELENEIDKLNNALNENMSDQKKLINERNAINTDIAHITNSRNDIPVTRKNNKISSNVPLNNASLRSEDLTNNEQIRDAKASNVPTSPVLTSNVPTGNVPTSNVPTSAIASTAVPSSAVPTSAVPTSAVPTSAVATSAVPTSAVASTAVPSSIEQLNNIPSSSALLNIESSNNDPTLNSMQPSTEQSIPTQELQPENSNYFQEIEKLKKALKDLNEALQNKEREAIKLNQEKQKLEDDLAKAQEEIVALRNKLANLNEKDELGKNRVMNLEAEKQLEKANIDLARLNEQLENKENAIRDATAKLEDLQENGDLEEQLKAMTNDYERLKKEKDELLKDLEKALTDKDDLEKRLANALDEMNDVKNTTDKKLNTQFKLEKSLKDEIKYLREELEAIDKKSTKLKALIKSHLHEDLEITTGGFIQQHKTQLLKSLDESVERLNKYKESQKLKISKVKKTVKNISPAPLKIRKVSESLRTKNPTKPKKQAPIKIHTTRNQKGGKLKKGACLAKLYREIPPLY